MTVTANTAPFVSGVEPEHRTGLTAVLRSEWTKLRSLRSTPWTLGVTAVLTIGLGALFSFGRSSGRGDEPIPPDFNAAGFAFNALYLTQLAIGVLGVLAITAEYSSGMIRTTFTAVPQRGKLLAVKAVVFGLVTLLVALVTAFVTFFVSQAIFRGSGRITAVSLSQSPTLRIVLGAAAYLTLCGLFGLALGALLRSTAAAISALAGILFVLPILMNFLPSSWHRDAIARWLPSNAGLQIINKTSEPGAFSPGAGLAVFVVEVAVAFIAALVLLRRRDV
jgi:ABC-type transport system involved in multi-copper enzyme maturation permease subunit